MSGSIYGKNFTITTWGESHGKALGVVIDGVPAGIFVDEGYIRAMMNRRKPGQNAYTTKRNESDEVQILSGVFEGKTTGTPISMVVFNEDQRSRDYSNIMNTYRPGHADYCFDKKYGFRDYRGGGRSSARETLARVAGGAIASLFLRELDIEVCAFAESVGGFKADTEGFGNDIKGYDISRIREECSQNPLNMPDLRAAEEAAKWLDTCMKEKNSAGGCIKIVIQGLPAGLGEPVFDKLDARLGQALFSIGAVKGVEIGAGFGASKATGAVNNDPFINEEGSVTKLTNNAGGILGGISDGSPVIARIAIKPTPSISRIQNTVNSDGNPVELEIKGRHDPIIVPRAVVVAESMCALTVADLLISNMSSKMEDVLKIYKGLAH